MKVMEQNFKVSDGKFDGIPNLGKPAYRKLRQKESAYPHFRCRRNYPSGI
jgi:hypothetical protein